MAAVVVLFHSLSPPSIAVVYLMRLACLCNFLPATTISMLSHDSDVGACRRRVQHRLTYTALLTCKRCVAYLTLVRPACELLEPLRFRSFAASLCCEVNVGSPSRGKVRPCL